VVVSFLHSCTVHLDVIKSLIRPTNAQLNCFKILKFTLKFTINAPTCLGSTKPSPGSLWLPGDGLGIPKHVGEFIVNFNVNFNILKQFNCALVGRIRDLITSSSAVQLWRKNSDHVIFEYCYSLMMV
jgi:hypothetical protein